MLLFSVVSLMASQIQINNELVNVRNVPMFVDGTNSIVVTNVTAGQVFEYTDVWCDYVKVKVIEGVDSKSTSDHVGKTGYMWARRVSGITGKQNVIVEGVCLRSYPEKTDNNLIAKVKLNATVEVLEPVVTWYKIPSGWVSASLVKKI